MLLLFRILEFELRSAVVFFVALIFVAVVQFAVFVSVAGIFSVVFFLLEEN